MKTVYDKKEHCSGCGACSISCNFNAIHMKPDVEGFLYPVVNQDLCVQCGKCQKICPFIKKNTKKDLPKVYAAKSFSDNVRKCSASGGSFTLLSDFVLNNGGSVYGAVFDSDMRVVHTCAVSKVEREPMRGSKYIQSKLDFIFRQVQQDVKSGKITLFTGTPCQIAGLKAFLGKDYSNLYLCDIVCHGVSSPEVFKEYISYIEKKYKSSVSKISFRDKEQGWSNQKWKIELNNGESLLDNKDVRIYKNLYYGHVIQRPSCHECPFTSIKRQSDITLGDFWGIEKSMPDFKDELGVNLILVNTSKGDCLFQQIKGNMKYVESNIEDCLQPQLKYPTEKSSKRDIFWVDYQRKGFSYVARKYGTVGLSVIIVGKIKKIAKSIIKSLHAINFE